MKHSFYLSICLIVSLSFFFGGCYGSAEKEEEAAYQEYKRSQEILNVKTNDNAANTQTTTTTENNDKQDTSLFVDETNEPIRFFFIGNDNEVFNGGTAPTFQIDSNYLVTEIWTYHWNGGKGSTGGTISVQDETGKNYGPFTVEVKNQVYWIAKINQNFPAGKYTIIDSDPSTLAQNPASQGQGHAWGYGIKQ